jgi:hypothetical protein
MVGPGMGWGPTAELRITLQATGMEGGEGGVQAMLEPCYGQEDATR